MSASKNCNQPFAFTPAATPSCYDYRKSDVAGCTNLDAVMNLTNVANVPFDNYGYLQAKTNCTDIYNPRRKTLNFTDSFPVWPLKNSKIYPTQDYTNDAFPLQPTPKMELNEYVDVTTNWPPKAIPLEPYRPTPPVASPATGTTDPNVARIPVLHLPTPEPIVRRKLPFLKFLVQAFNAKKGKFRVGARSN